MKLFSILSIVFILAACNDSSDTATVSKTDTTADTVKPDTKTPGVTATEDMLKPSVVNNAAWERKKENGIAWLGIGTEPFWSVERKNDSLFFQLSDWKKPVSIHVARLTNSKDSVVYSGFDDWTLLHVVIRPEKCSDGMSDRKYDYSLKVIYNGAVYKGCAVIF